MNADSANPGFQGKTFARLVTVCAAVILLWAVPVAAQPGSRDCSKVATPVERIICADRHIWPYEAAARQAWDTLGKALAPDDRKPLADYRSRWLSELAAKCRMPASRSHTDAHLRSAAPCVRDRMEEHAFRLVAYGRRYGVSLDQLESAGQVKADTASRQSIAWSPRDCPCTTGDCIEEKQKPAVRVSGRLESWFAFLHYGFGENPLADDVVRVQVLVLDRPVCVRPAACADGAASCPPRLHRNAMVSGDDDVRRHVGRHVSVSGVPRVGDTVYYVVPLLLGRPSISVTP